MTSLDLFRMVSDRTIRISSTRACRTTSYRRLEAVPPEIETESRGPSPSPHRRPRALVM